MEDQKIIGLETTHDIDEVQIADDVIAVIAEIAALEVDGVSATAPTKTEFVQQAISSKKKAKGVKIEVSDDSVFIELSLIVKYGVKIQDMSTKVQQKVKNSVETMTGLNVSAVNVHVVGVQFEKGQEI